MADAPPFLSAADLARLVGPDDAVAAIEAEVADLDPGVEPARSAVTLAAGQLLLMPSAGPASVGVKLATVAPRNGAQGLPRIHAVYVLFDPDTLAPIALMDGAALTTLRTPAVSIAAVRPVLQARGDALRVVVFGAGPQAHGHVATLAATVELADVAFVTPDPRGRDRVLELGSAAAEAVLRAADVVVCATTAREPLFDSAMLCDDAVVMAVGSHEPDARELDSALLGRAQVVVEDVDTALRECGDVVLAVGDDAITAADLIPMRSVVTGGRRLTADRPVVFKGSGMAWQDRAVAARVYSEYLKSEG